MGLSWTTIVWSMNASACLTIGLLHLSIWIKQRGHRGHLVLSVAAVSVAAIAACELSLMHAQTPEQYGALLRMGHVPVFTLLVSMVLFVRLRFHTGRLWLAYSVCGLRLLALLLNFYFDPNLNYREISGLRHLPIWGGETVSMPVGVFNPWTRIGELSSLLFLVFVTDATVTLWRRSNTPERRRIAVINGGFALFILLAFGHAALVHMGVIHSPYLISLAFLPIVVGMSYGLTEDVVRAAQLTVQVKEHEVDLRRSERRMDQATTAAELGIWEWDIHRDEIWATERCRELFGFTFAERLDLNRFLNVLHPDDRDAVQQEVQRLLVGGNNFDRECRVVLPDGRIRWVVTRGRVDLDIRDEPVLLRGVSLDITRRKEAELELARQRNELAHLSRVTVVGEMSGSIAHELNQPLTAILSNAQAAQRLLDRDAIDLDEIREILKDIVADDKRAGEVIHGLRQLLRKGEVDRQRIDLNDQVRDVLRLVRSDLLNGGITVNTELAPLLPRVKGDRVQLQQVLLNLIANGCDAMAEAAPAARQLVVRTGLDAEGRVQLTVVDNGRGIPPENLERVFDPFYTTKKQGLGMGLSVCRTIISAQGGYLWAENNTTRGARFQFTMPRVPKSDQE